MASLLSKNTFISVVGGRRIAPGQNIIPSQELTELQKNPFVKGMIEIKKYVISDTGIDLELVDNEGKDITATIPEAKKAAMEIKELTVKEAIIKIAGDPKDKEDNGILDIEVLQEIEKIDNRKGIQDAVKEQIELLYARDAEDKEEE